MKFNETCPPSCPKCARKLLAKGMKKYGKLWICPKCKHEENYETYDGSNQPDQKEIINLIDKLTGE